MLKAVAVAFALAAAPMAAQAQTVGSFTPNGGGYTVVTPGARNVYSYASPQPNGGWIVVTPGARTTTYSYAMPMPQAAPAPVGCPGMAPGSFAAAFGCPR